MMEAHPAAGIVQTVAMPTGRDTLFARVQQFAHRVYTPLFAAGIHFWHLGESYYWGHNAIIRVEPFIRHCALARLPERGPLGGELLSHDFVEAALMRRAGWHVWIVHDLAGSWEEMPPTLLDELRRDRRWCHGNLQHSRLFLAQGLHPAHRALFMAGVMTYVSALLWLLFLALCTALLAVHVLVPPVYFTQPFQLFPVWPEWRPQWALALFGATAALLLLPKLLATVLLARGGAHGFGGRAALVAGVLLEVVFSSLLAPIRMLFHARFVVSALLDLVPPKWQPPPRENVETSWREAIVRHGLGTLLGVAWAGFAAWLNPAFLPWLLPVAGSLIAAIPLSVWSSRVRAGVAFRAARLFLTPEESAPPPELSRLRRLMLEPPAAAGLGPVRVDPLVDALVRAADPRHWRIAGGPVGR
jgi:membrane glycosyltransferase